MRNKRSSTGRGGRNNNGGTKNDAKRTGGRPKKVKFKYGKGKKDKFITKQDFQRQQPAERKETAEDRGLTRLNKYLANAGVCSRREADVLIEAGAVTVNGEVITSMGYKVKEGDDVKYEGETIRKETMRYVLLNKPKNFITTTFDPQGRKTVMSLVNGACKERIYPVGRLDRNTTGLLLFTNDGNLSLKLTHPSSQIKKIYEVEADKPVQEEDLEKLRKGIHLEDGFIRVNEIDFVGSGTNRKKVGLEIHSGRNRIVRRMMEHLGYEVVKLDRVMFGTLTKKDLPRGEWRLVGEDEVNLLKAL